MPTSVLKLNMVFIAAIVIMVVPTIVVAVIGLKSADSLAMLAAMGGLFSAAGLGWRGLSVLTLASGLGTFLASLVGTNPLSSAVLMLAVGVALGAGNKWGMSVWNFMFPVLVAAVIAQPPHLIDGTLANAAVTGATTMGCILLGGFLTMLLVRKPVQTTVATYPLKVNVMYAVNLGLLLAGAGYFAAVIHQELLGMWAALTVVVILIEPYAGQTSSKALQRAGGTILGFLLAIGVSASFLPDFLFYAAGLLFLEVALLLRFRGRRKYWEYVMFLTPGVVLLSGSPAHVDQVSDYRLYATVLAAVASLLVLGIERLLFWRGGLNKPVIDASPSAE
jgi:hypothetical protein